MIYRIQKTYDEIMDILNLKYVPIPTIGYTLPPGICENSYIFFDVKVFTSQ